MKKSWSRRVWMVVACVVATVGSVGAAGSAEVVRDAHLLHLNSPVEIGSVQLTVAGPGDFLYQETFDGKEERVFDLRAGLENAADGVYRWSLTYAASVDVEGWAKVEADRLSADGLRSGTVKGSFLVRDGEIVRSRGHEAEPLGAAPGHGLPTKDQVINDDLIVQQRACVGFNCLDGETFSGDATLLLKYTNLRIRFDDTTVDPNFPSNDWQLTANDSTSSGISKFSIDDLTGETTPFTVEAGAPTDALYIEDSGNLGLGTSMPAVEMHVLDGDSPTLRLEQDTSLGFQERAWDLRANETEFVVRDVTNLNNTPFRVRAGAETNALYVDSSSRVGVNTAPAVRLHVKEEGVAGGLRLVGRLENNGPASLQLLDTNSGDNWVFTNKPTGFEISKGGTGVIEMRVDGSGNLRVPGSVITGMNTYPDYVFDEGYDLMSLDDLGAFISANGHLPNLKDESEVAYGKRVDLSELSRRLLEKVEELTLYTLEQHETDRELRRTIEAQSALIEVLEARLAAVEGGR